jgi:hypothetical protein
MHRMNHKPTKPKRMQNELERQITSNTTYIATATQNNTSKQNVAKHADETTTQPNSTRNRKHTPALKLVCARVYDGIRYMDKKDKKDKKDGTCGV